MSNQKFVILRGKVATGKTTALNNLRKSRSMRDWVIIDHGEIKHWFDCLTDEEKKPLRKEVLFNILKTVIKTKKNILMDEMSADTIKKKLGPSIRKFGYEIIVFQFTAHVNSSIKRESDRMKVQGLKPLGEKWVKKMHKWHEEREDPKGILVDCDKLDKKGVVRFILKELRRK